MLLDSASSYQIRVKFVRLSTRRITTVVRRKKLIRYKAVPLKFPHWSRHVTATELCGRWSSFNVRTSKALQHLLVAVVIFLPLHSLVMFPRPRRPTVTCTATLNPLPAHAALLRKTIALRLCVW